MLRKILNNSYTWVAGGLLTAVALTSSAFELEDRYNRLVALLIVVPACVITGAAFLVLFLRTLVNDEVIPALNPNAWWEKKGE